MAMRLGDILVAEHATTREALESALATACTRLGDTLRLRGLIDGRALADALARQHHLPRADLIRDVPDATLFTPRDLALYLEYCFVPYRRAGAHLLIAAVEVSDALHAFLEMHYGQAVSFAITTERELKHYLRARGGTTTTRRAVLNLRRRFRHLAADRVLVPHQMRGLYVLLTALMLALGLAPHSSWSALLVICNVFYLASLLIRMEFYRQGVAAQRMMAQQEAALSVAAQAIPATQLPVYTILVPLYRESTAVMARLIDTLNALDYPEELLDIKLICEADDHVTLHALKSLNPPAKMEILSVPPSQPRTKPKACNVALAQARGEFVVIYDAEDAPAPDQLRRAVAQFRTASPEVACLQAALNYYNRDETLLTQLFAIEYSALFKLLLPGLERMGLPIPLGGTSNHLRIATLRIVGGWDAFNVTEDADLGIRLAYHGYRTQSLASLTLEESPIRVRAWLKQRTRWIKGYIQTWLVYTRDRRALKERLGSAGYYGFQFFVGAPALTFLLSPILWGVFVLSLTGNFPVTLSTEIQLLCAASFSGGIISQWLYARKVLRIEGWHQMRLAFLIYPFYWLLHSLAAARALVQLVTHPHYWDKTTHGVTRVLQK